MAKFNAQPTTSSAPASRQPADTTAENTGEEGVRKDRGNRSPHGTRCSTVGIAFNRKRWHNRGKGVGHEYREKRSNTEKEQGNASFQKLGITGNVNHSTVNVN